MILPERGRRIRAAVVAVSLCVLSYNLTYFQGFEYHYAALLPLLPAMLWLWQRESVPWLRRLLMGCFLASLPLFLPIPTFLGPDDPYVWQLSRLPAGRAGDDRFLRPVRSTARHCLAGAVCGRELVRAATLHGLLRRRFAWAAASACCSRRGGKRLRDGACPPADRHEKLDAAGLGDPPGRRDQPTGRSAGVAGRHSQGSRATVRRGRTLHRPGTLPESGGLSVAFGAVPRRLGRLPFLPSASSTMRSNSVKGRWNSIRAWSTPQRPWGGSGRPRTG